MFSETLKGIATETERTAKRFAQMQQALLKQERYFRFNVEQGLQDVGLEEYKRGNVVVSATSEYMEKQEMLAQTQKCSLTMKDKECWQGGITEFTRRILGERQHEGRKFRLVFSLAAAPEIDYFVGRESDLLSIERVLLPFTTANRKVVFLHRLGGIGKSQLAIEYAKKHRLVYTAVLWFNAKTEETLKHSFATNAKRLPEEYLSDEILDGPQTVESFRAILRGMKTWLDLSGNDQWLLIYDNVDNPKIPDNKQQDACDIRSYFPGAYHGSILVTTRWKTLRIGYPHEVKKLSNMEESISLLAQTSRRRSMREGQYLHKMILKSQTNFGIEVGINKLQTKLDGLPLALATAGAYLGLTDMSVSEYLDHHDSSWLALQKTSLRLLSYEDQTIFSSWNLSYIYIHKEDQSAAKMLELWGYLDNQDLRYGLLEAGKKMLSLPSGL